MTVVTADSALQTQLHGLTGPAEIRDREGNLLGYYTPCGYEEEALYRLADSRFDPAEVRAQLAQGGGCSTEELLNRLQGHGDA